MANTVNKMEKSAIPIYGAAVVWAVYAVLFDLYQVNHFIFVALLSIGVYLLLQSMCPEKAVETAIPKEAEPKSTGSEELDKMIKDGQLAISEMKRLDGNIVDEKISAGIRRLETVCQGIFDQVKADPSKLPQIHKFMDYYLPTTLKLLNAYDRMDAAGVSGQNIDGTKRRVEDIMSTIVAAFEKQLDSLFSSDALDISTDISVLETMLAREGLAGEKMEASKGGGSGINLEL